MELLPQTLERLHGEKEVVESNSVKLFICDYKNSWWHLNERNEVKGKVFYFLKNVFGNST